MNLDFSISSSADDSSRRSEIPLNYRSVKELRIPPTNFDVRNSVPIQVAMRYDFPQVARISVSFMWYA
jgi:hypothetical protein